VSFGDGHTSHLEGIGTSRIKIFDGLVRELQDVRYVPQLKKTIISVGNFKSTDPKRDTWRMCSQDIQWLIGCSEGYSKQQLVLLKR